MESRKPEGRAAKKTAPVDAALSTRMQQEPGAHVLGSGGAIPPDDSGLTVNPFTVRLGADKPEAKVVVPVGRPRVSGAIVPTAAAIDAVSPRGCAR